MIFPECLAWFWFAIAASPFIFKYFWRSVWLHLLPSSCAQKSFRGTCVVIFRLQWNLALTLLQSALLLLVSSLPLISDDFVKRQTFQQSVMAFYAWLLHWILCTEFRRLLLILCKKKSKVIITLSTEAIGLS